MTISHFQSAFATTPDEGVVGHPASTGDYLAESLNNDEAATAIGFGLGVKVNGEDGCKLPASSADAITGVTMYIPLVQPDSNFDRKVPTTGVCLVMRRGRIWVAVEETVAKGDPVYVRHTANGAGKDPGQFRKSSDGSEGVYPQVSWTLSGALDAGQDQVATLTYSGVTEAADTTAMTVDGTAIVTQTFAGDNDSYLRAVAEAIKQAGIAAAAGPNGGSTIKAINVRPVDGAATNDRVIEILSYAGFPTVITAIVFTDASAGGVTLTLAVAQANAAPHTLTLDVDGTTVTQLWAGTHDDTVHAFAAELAGLAKVASAVVSHVAAGPDLVITLTGANYAADDIDLTNGDPTGGATARTGALSNEVVAGVAVGAKAAQWTAARYAKGAASGKNALLEVFGTA